MPRRIVTIICSSLIACVDGGQGLELPTDSTLAFIAQVQGREVRLRRLASGENAEPLAVSGDAETYLLSVAEARLLTFAPAIDPASYAEISPVLVEAPTDECDDVGSLIAAGPDGGAVLEIRGNAVGQLYRVEIGSSELELTPVEAWPASLLGLSLRVPLDEPCPALPAEVRAFGAGGPVVDFGRPFGPGTLTESRVEESNVHGVEYLDDDHVLVLWSHVLGVMRRGQQISEGTAVGSGAPDFPPTPEPNQAWRFIDLDLSPPDGDGRRQGHLLLYLHESGSREDFVGAGIVRFTVTSTSISGFELRHVEPARANEDPASSLLRIAHHPGGGFGAVGRGLTVTGDEDGPVKVGRRIGVNAADVLFLPEPFPPAVIQGRSNDWWFGRLDFIENMRRETSDAAATEVSGSTHLLDGPSGARLVSSNNLPRVFVRQAEDDWRRHRWWLPTASRCASDTPICGRGQPQGLAAMRDFGAPEGGGIVHSFDQCPVVFRTYPLENRCSEAIAVNWSEDYMHPGAEESSILAVASRGNRVLFGGNHGALVEVTLP